jgi:hypothetical protein
MKNVEKVLTASPRWRVRTMDEFSADELARLQAKLEGWMQQALPKAGGKRSRYHFALKAKPARGT